MRTPRWRRRRRRRRRSRRRRRRWRRGRRRRRWRAWRWRQRTWWRSMPSTSASTGWTGGRCGGRATAPAARTSAPPSRCSSPASPAPSTSTGRRRGSTGRRTGARLGRPPRVPRRRGRRGGAPPQRALAARARLCATIGGNGTLSVVYVAVATPGNASLVALVERKNSSADAAPAEVSVRTILKKVAPTALARRGGLPVLHAGGQPADPPLRARRHALRPPPLVRRR